MKNMALDDLVLVRPRQFPHPDATARASGADDLLARARVVPDLAAALSGIAAWCSRPRRASAISIFGWLMPGSRRGSWLTAAALQPVAVVFGAERSGLSNEELNTAHALLRIPANPAYAALNLAHGGADRQLRDPVRARRLRAIHRAAASRSEPLATADGDGAAVRSISPRCSN